MPYGNLSGTLWAFIVSLYRRLTSLVAMVISKTLMAEMSPVSSSLPWLLHLCWITYYVNLPQQQYTLPLHMHNGPIHYMVQHILQCTCFVCLQQWERLLVEYSHAFMAGEILRQV